MLSSKLLFICLVFCVIILTAAQRSSSRGGSTKPARRGSGSSQKPIRGTGGSSRKPTRGGSGSKPPTSSAQTDEDPACTAADGSAGHCRPISSCVFQFDDLEQLQKSSCNRPKDEKGVCCPNQASKTSGASPISPPSTTSARRGPGTVRMPDISSDDIGLAGRKGISQVDELQKLENELIRRGLFTQRGTAEAFHQAFFGNKEIGRTLGRDGLVSVEASLELARRFSLSPIQGRDGLVRFNLNDTIASRTCPKKPRCPSTKYRTIDGSCNNLKYSDWGKSFTAFQRFLPPRYADGVSAPRIAKDGGPLPSGRAVTAAANTDRDIPHPLYTLVIMQWAQFLDHDFSLTVATRLRNGNGIKCCDPEILKDPRLRHPACMEIDIPRDDKFYAKHMQTCMEFVRNAPSPRPSCTLGPREQINQLTSFIDGSQVYGSTDEESQRLREFKDGRLKVLHFNNVDLLPRETNRSEECVQQQAELFCFMAGDERVNEQISLTTMHTVWLRQHNKIAAQLLKLNPGWTDEIIFQETRRIVGAQIQHITYNEFLPLLIGRRVMKAFDLLLEPYGYSMGYDSELNPMLANAFAAAAYRYGHTLVQGNVNLLDEQGRVKNSVKLHTQFFNPALIYGPGNLDGLIRGLTGQPAQTFDTFITDQLTNHLFQPPDKKFGLDLIALNIQRGRDHGIPGYNEWREFCGLKKFTSFDELFPIMHASSARAFAKHYKSVDDIDLFPAGVAEFSLPGATLGPTLGCIGGEMFRRLKHGDRFWYENGGKESSFTEAQLAQVRKTNLARIMCDNSDNIQSMQPLAFIQPANWNPKLPCKSALIPRLNLAAWKNEPVWA